MGVAYLKDKEWWGRWRNVVIQWIRGMHGDKIYCIGKFDFELNWYICMHACSFKFCKDFLSAVKNQYIFCLSMKISCHMIQCKAIIEKRGNIIQQVFYLFWNTWMDIEISCLINWLTSLNIPTHFVLKSIFACWLSVNNLIEIKIS